MPEDMTLDFGVWIFGGELKLNADIRGMEKSARS